MRRTGRTPIDDNAVNGNLDKSDAQVFYAQFLSQPYTPRQSQSDG